jgi:GT2 family glycosyltransferase
VEECISSVLEHSGGELANLIIVNDNSPDSGVREYLEGLDGSDPRIKIINNSENLGYLRSCNKGIAASKNDVVLLNSDTVATGGWLKKMIACACSSADIAAVSPLTNNSILCSVPMICAENVVPEDIGIERYARIVEECSLKRYRVMPSCFGFCMFVKRAVIDEIGMLDEAYGKGYYEEIDFCCRAREAGYKNVLCDDTYIHHYGSVSFSTEKNSLSTENEKVISQRYPYILGEMRAYIDEKAISDIQLNLMVHTMLWASGRKTVFFMLHKNPFDTAEHVRGGVEYYMWDMVRNLEGCDYAVWYPEGSTPLVSKYVLVTDVGGVRAELEFKLKSPVVSGTAHSAEVAGILRQSMAALDVSAVHIPPFLRNTDDILDVCSSMGIPYYITLHDFYAICPNYTLMTPDGRYCGVVDDAGNCVCEKCFSGRGHMAAKLVEGHRSAMRAALDGAERVFVPSRFLKESVEKLFGGISCDVK